jgi:hypothetical protein
MGRMTALAARKPGAKLTGMKLRALFAQSLFLVASLSLTGPLLAQDTSGYAPAQNSPDATTPPVAKGKHVISGVVLSRANGGFLGLEIDPGTNTLKISFYDKSKTPIAPDVASATLIWYFHDTGKQKLVYAFGPGADGKSFASPRAVEPPLPHRAVLYLFSDTTSGNPAEAYQGVDLSPLVASQ